MLDFRSFYNKKKDNINIYENYSNTVDNQRGNILH